MSDLVIRPATTTDIPDIVAMLADDSLGAAQLQLTSHGSRAEAHRFYERLGFTDSHHGFKMALS